MAGSGREERGGLSRDTVYDLLNHSYRRAILACLEQHDMALTLADAAEEVARSVEDESVQDIDAEEIKRIYIDLYHSHIPRLEAHDTVQYSQDRDLIALTQQGEQLAEYIDRLG